MSSDPVLQSVDYKTEYNEFFSAVGDAITKWGMVDQLLFQMFHWATNTNMMVAATLFYRMNTISEHLEAVDKLLAIVLTRKKHRSDWQAIYKDAKGILNFRNELAHNPAALYGETTISKLGDIIKQEQGLMITKMLSKQLYKKSPFTAKTQDIKTHIDATNQILIRLYTLCQAPKRRANPLPESHLQKAPRPKGRGKRKAPNQIKRNAPRRSSPT